MTAEEHARKIIAEIQMQLIASLAQARADMDVLNYSLQNPASSNNSNSNNVSDKKE